MTTPLVTYRPFISGYPEQSDADPFVVETWAKVRWPLPTAGTDGRLHRAHWLDWFADVSPSIEYIARTGACYVAILEQVILGFICLDCHGVIQMIYVKRDFRGWRIGYGLLCAAMGREVQQGETLFVHEPNVSFEAWACGKGLKWKSA